MSFDTVEGALRSSADAQAGLALPDLGPTLELSGLADVVFAVEPSPVGELLLAASPKGLLCVHYLSGTDDLDRTLQEIASRLTPRVVAGVRRLEPARRELDEFFSGRRRDFDLDLDWSLVRSGFTRTVLRETARIPFGQTTSYAGIAALAGSPKAHRAAGTALGSNPLPIVIPCHRILRTGGGLGGYAGGLAAKRELLRIEGVLLA